MMLVAKYAKVFCRTGTQPFLLTCHVGDRLGVTILTVYVQFAAHWHANDLVVELS